MSDELKPCPFCGNLAVSEVVRPHFGKGTIAIECNSCKTRGPETRFESFDDKYTAHHRTAWNTRPDSKPYKFSDPEAAFIDRMCQELGGYAGFKCGFNAAREHKKG